MQTKEKPLKQGYNIVENKVRIANKLVKTIDIKQLQETIEKARTNAYK